MKRFPLWQKQLFFVTVATLLLTVPFWISHLDLQVSGYFYHTDTPQAFPLKYAPFWYAIYKLIPVLSVLVAVTSLGAITISYLFDNYRNLRRPALAVFLTFLLGPGLLVNGVFKEHYGRPRPSQVENFGGQYPYVAPLVYGGYKNAKSFPSGHSSIGFAFIIFYLLWRKRRPSLAKLALIATLILGCITGMARIVGGGHFLSDVLWSFYMVTITAILVNHFIVEKNTGPTPVATRRQRIIAIICAGGFSVILLVWLLLSLPFDLQQQRALNLQGVKVLSVDVPKGRFHVQYKPDAIPRVEVTIDGYGFTPLITCDLKQYPTRNGLSHIESTCKGWFREARQDAILYLPSSLKNTIEVKQ